MESSVAEESTSVEERTAILEGTSPSYHQVDAERDDSMYNGKNLVSEMGRMMHAFHRAFHTMAGMSTAQWRILSLLAREETLSEQDIHAKIGAKLVEESGKFKGLSQRKIQQLLGVDAAGITRVAKQLEHDGLIRRETDASDNRFTIAYLTAAGRELYDEIEHKAEFLWQQAFTGVNREAIVQIRSTIQQLADNLSAFADEAEK